MADALTEVHHDWVTDVCGFDPRGRMNAMAAQPPTAAASPASAPSPDPPRAAAAQPAPLPTSAKDDPVWKEGFRAGLATPLTDVQPPTVYTAETEAVFLDGVAAGQAEAARRAAPPPPPEPVAPSSNDTAAPPADTNRYVQAIKLAAGKLGGAVGGKLLELVSPANIALMTAFMAAYIAAQSTPAGWFADGVAVVGLVASAAFIGRELFTVIDDIRAFVAICGSPSGDLDSAADHLAHAVATIGVDTLVILLTHKAGNAAKAYVKPPQGYVDVVTPNGRVIRMPVEVAKDPAMQTRGSGQGGGDPAAPDAAKIQARDALATEKGKLTAKGRSEADTVTQAIGEGKVRAPGKPRRINPDAGEPDHDFAMEKDGKVTGYVEIKTPVDPKLRPLATQATDIGTKIMELKPDAGLQIVVDLKNLAAADQVAFIEALRATGLDIATVTFLNR